MAKYVIIWRDEEDCKDGDLYSVEVEGLTYNVFSKKAAKCLVEDARSEFPDTTYEIVKLIKPKKETQ